MVGKLRSPFAPMEAISVDQIPVGPEWQYEPKWDGFRCLSFRDGGTVTLQSKSCKPLTRYFHDVVDAVRSIKAESFVLDGEIVVPSGKVFSFDALLQRIHPAASRVHKLAEETPALMIVFDLLASPGGVLIDRPLPERRQLLEAFARNYFSKNGRIRLSPATAKIAEANKWLTRGGATLDGIIAKRCDMPYSSGNRHGMQKIKNYRSADCVVGGFRYNEGKPVVGSLLLGLYDDNGDLNHVGFASNIPHRDKPALTRKLEKLISPPGFTGNAPGGPSRWSTARSAEWQPLRPKLVVEVGYDHFSGGRFRHGTSLMRWRPDKAPKQCKMDQLSQKKGDLMKLLE
jgi:ATP-dependent DNA ligase